MFRMPKVRMYRPRAGVCTFHVLIYIYFLCTAPQILGCIMPNLFRGGWDAFLFLCVPSHNVYVCMYEGHNCCQTRQNQPHTGAHKCRVKNWVKSNKKNSRCGRRTNCGNSGKTHTRGTRRLQKAHANFRLEWNEFRRVCFQKGRSERRLSKKDESRVCIFGQLQYTAVFWPVAAKTGGKKRPRFSRVAAVGERTNFGHRTMKFLLS